MDQFLSWSNKEKPSHLEVIAFNERALSFYTHYGFKKTDKEIEPFAGKFPVAEMIRPIEK